MEILSTYLCLCVSLFLRQPDIYRKVFALSLAVFANQTLYYEMVQRHPVKHISVVES